MVRRIAVGCVVAMFVFSFGAGSAGAQVFGTFTWQMQPYCNRVTLTLTSVTGNFTLDGSDDQCGGAKKGAASGIGVFNPDGTVGINFTIVPPSGPSVHVSASVSPANGQGTWSDDHGNSGTFAFFGNTAGLPSRPTPDVHFRSPGINAQAVANGFFGPITTWSGAPAENLGGGTFTPATGVYTIPSSGLYMITAMVRWPAFSAATGYYCSYIFTSGTRRVSDCQAPSTTASFQIQTFSTVLSLASGVPVTVQVFNGSGAATSVGPSSNETLFTVTRLR